MNYLYLTILFPLLGYVILAFTRSRLSENVSAAIGVGSIGLSALTTLNRRHAVSCSACCGHCALHTASVDLAAMLTVSPRRFSLHLDGLSLTLAWRGDRGWFFHSLVRLVVYAR
jgi:NADH-quinone oxidoreductase subunit L